jgi:hypothetical protein
LIELIPNPEYLWSEEVGQYGLLKKSDTRAELGAVGELTKKEMYSSAARCSPAASITQANGKVLSYRNPTRASNEPADIR